MPHPDAWLMITPRRCAIIVGKEYLAQTPDARPLPGEVLGMKGLFVA